LPENPDLKIHYFETGTFYIDEIELIGPGLGSVLPPQIGDMVIDLALNQISINIAGAEPNTTYILEEAVDLDFSNPDQSPIPLTGASASVGSMDSVNHTFTTDSNGDASIQGVSLGGEAKPSTFIRAKSVP